jgi:thiol-disulfide isomerase/thioredoxin
MNGLKKAVVALGLVGLLSSPYLLNKAYAQEATQTVSQEPGLEQLAKEWNMPVSKVEAIAQEMKQPVAETLKGYAKPVCHDTYNREVFQENLPKEQRKPVLVLFYVDEPKSDDAEGIKFSRGLSSVYKALAKEFGNKIKFLSYNSDCDSWSNYDIHVNLRENYGVEAPPSIVMYTSFDLLNGGTPVKNEGRIKIIDTLKGGLSKVESWETFYSFLGKEWILTNTSNSKDYVWRFGNSNQERKISLK